MATLNEGCGWRWDAGERGSRKGAVRRVQRQAAKFAEQVRRLKIHAPEFAGPADQTLRVITTGLSRLLTLDLTSRGPKHHAISPAEADRLLDSASEVFRPWQVLASAPDFALAVRAANKAARQAAAEARWLAESFRELLDLL